MYSTDFFRRQATESLSGALGILPVVLDLVSDVGSLIDVGCGLGTWASVAQKLRPRLKVFGVDGSSGHDIPMRLSPEAFSEVDITKPFLLGAKFDLAICLEVAEHISAADLHGLLGNLTRLAPIVLFSAAIPGQGGDFHINEQWPSYWAARFQEFGFQCADVIRPLVWSNATIPFYYRQNVMFYMIPSQVRRLPVRTDWGGADLVHPEFYDHVRTETIPGAVAARALFEAVKKRVRDRFRSAV